MRFRYCIINRIYGLFSYNLLTSTFVKHSMLIYLTYVFIIMFILSFSFVSMDDLLVTFEGYYCFTFLVRTATCFFTELLPNG